MFNWASLVASVAKLWNSYLTWRNNQRQQELGAKEAVLEGKKEVENEIERVNKPITNADIVREQASSSNRANRRKKTSV